jgi:hypothetical protein
MMPSVIPGFVKTWTISPNNAFTSGGISISNDNLNFMLVFVNWLLANGWTCGGSGTGTTGGTYAYAAHGTPGTSLWVALASFGGSAWIRLINSTMGIELLFQEGASYQFTCNASYLGFTGGAGSVSATVAPTATDSFKCNSGGASDVLFNGAMFSGKYHTWKSSDGYVNHFILYVNSVPVFHFHVEKPTNAVAGLPSAVISIRDQNNGTTTNVDTVVTWTSMNGPWYTYFASAIRYLSYALVAVGVSNSYGAILVQALLVPNLLDGNWSITPLGAAIGTNAYGGLYFWFADLWLIASSLQEGCLMPSTAPYQVVVVGDLLMPWLNSSVPMQVS